MHDVEEGRSAAEEEIRALLAEQAAATRAHDADRVVATYAPRMVLFGLAPPLSEVSEAPHDTAALREWHADFTGPIEQELHDLVISVDGDVAFGHCLTHLTATTVSGESIDLWSRTTIGLRRVNGTWRITHQHDSTPFHMDGSFRAAVDLRP